ncbi:hypothetical protein J2TS4_11150 [Paenibacillus sp. J2TS4]|nr:hypothetical protein J2TS4_11150 [Paenibacillus sp. J2TS4]
MAQYPKVNFRIAQASMEDMGQLIENGEIDFCFTAMPIERPGISALPVLNEEVFLAVPSGHRLAERDRICLSQAADEPFVGYKEGYPFRTMNDEFCRAAGFRPHVVYHVKWCCSHRSDPLPGRMQNQ